MTGSYDNVWQVLQSATRSYYKVRQEVITKCDKKSLQSTRIIIKCDNYHKVRRNTVNTCGKVSFLIKFQARPEAVYKMTPSQVFSCEFWDIFKKTFLQNTSGWILMSAFTLSLWLHVYLCEWMLHIFFNISCGSVLQYT